MEKGCGTLEQHKRDAIPLKKKKVKAAVSGWGTKGNGGRLETGPKTATAEARGGGSQVKPTVLPWGHAVIKKKRENKKAKGFRNEGEKMVKLL